MQKGKTNKFQMQSNFNFNQISDDDKIVEDEY